MARKTIYNPLLEENLQQIDDGTTPSPHVVTKFTLPGGKDVIPDSGAVAFSGVGVDIVPNGAHGIAFKAHAQALSILANNVPINPVNGRWKFVSSDNNLEIIQGTDPEDVDFRINEQGHIPILESGATMTADAIMVASGVGNEVNPSPATIDPSGALSATDAVFTGDVQVESLSVTDNLDVVDNISCKSIDVLDLGDSGSTQEESVVVADIHGTLKRLTMREGSFPSIHSQEIVQAVIQGDNLTGITVESNFDTVNDIYANVIKANGALALLYKKGQNASTEHGLLSLEADGTLGNKSILPGRGINIIKTPQGFTIALSNPDGIPTGSKYGVTIAPHEDRSFGSFLSSSIFNWPVDKIYDNGIVFNIDASKGWMFTASFGDGFYCFAGGYTFFMNFASGGQKSGIFFLVITVLNPDNSVARRIVKDVPFSGRASDRGFELHIDTSFSYFMYLNKNQKIFVTADLAGFVGNADISAFGVFGTENTATYGGYLKTYLSLVPILGSNLNDPLVQNDVGAIVYLTNDLSPSTPTGSINILSGDFTVEYKKDVEVANDPTIGWVFTGSYTKGLYLITGIITFELSMVATSAERDIDIVVVLHLLDNTGNPVGDIGVYRSNREFVSATFAGSVTSTVSISQVIDIQKDFRVYVSIISPSIDATSGVTSIVAKGGRGTQFAFVKVSSNAGAGDGDIKSVPDLPVEVGSIATFTDAAGKTITNSKAKVDGIGHMTVSGITSSGPIQASGVQLGAPLPVAQGGTGRGSLPTGVLYSDSKNPVHSIAATAGGQTLTSQLDTQGNLSYAFVRHPGGITSTSTTTVPGAIPVYDSLDGTKVKQSELTTVPGGGLRGVREMDGELAVKGSLTIRNDPGQLGNVTLENGNLTLNRVLSTNEIQASGDASVGGDLSVTSLKTPPGKNLPPTAFAALNAVGTLFRQELDVDNSFLTRFGNTIVPGVFQSDPDGSIRYNIQKVGGNVVHTVIADGVLGSIHSVAKQIIAKQLSAGLLAMKQDGTATTAQLIGVRGITIRGVPTSSGEILEFGIDSVSSGATYGIKVYQQPAAFPLAIFLNTPTKIHGKHSVDFLDNEVVSFSPATSDDTTPWTFTAHKTGVFQIAMNNTIKFSPHANEPTTVHFLIKAFVDVTKKVDSSLRSYTFSDDFIYEQINSGGILQPVYKSVSFSDIYLLEEGDSIQIRYLVDSNGATGTLPTPTIDSNTDGERKNEISLVSISQRINVSGGGAGSFGGLLPNSGSIATPSQSNQSIALYGEGITNTYTKPGEPNALYVGTSSASQNRLFGVSDATASPNLTGDALAVLVGGLVKIAFGGSPGAPTFKIETSEYSGSLDAAAGTTGFLFSNNTTIGSSTVSVVPNNVAEFDFTKSPVELTFKERFADLANLPAKTGVLLITSFDSGSTADIITVPVSPVGTSPGPLVLLDVAGNGSSPEFRNLTSSSDALQWRNLGGSLGLVLSHHLLSMENIPDNSLGFVYKDEESNDFIPVKLVGGTNVQIDMSRARSDGIATINFSGGGDVPIIPIIPSDSVLPNPDPSSSSYLGRFFNTAYVTNKFKKNVTTTTGLSQSIDFSTFDSSQDYSLFFKTLFQPSIYDSTKVLVQYSGENFRFKFAPAGSLDFSLPGVFNLPNGQERFIQFMAVSEVGVSSGTIKVDKEDPSSPVLGNIIPYGFSVCAPGSLMAIPASFCLGAEATIPTGAGSPYKVATYLVPSDNTGVSYSANSKPEFYGRANVTSKLDKSDLPTMNVFDFVSDSEIVGRTSKTQDLNKFFKSNCFIIPSDGMWIIYSRVIAEFSAGGEYNAMCMSFNVIDKDIDTLELSYDGNTYSQPRHNCRSFYSSSIQTTLGRTISDTPVQRTISAEQKMQAYFRKGEMLHAGFAKHIIWADKSVSFSPPTGTGINPNIKYGSSYSMQMIHAGEYKPIIEHFPEFGVDFSSPHWMAVNLTETENQQVTSGEYTIDSYSSVIGKLNPPGATDLINTSCVMDGGDFVEKKYRIVFTMDMFFFDTASSIDNVPQSISLIGLKDKNNTIFYINHVPPCRCDRFVHFFYEGELYMAKGTNNLQLKILMKWSNNVNKPTSFKNKYTGASDVGTEVMNSVKPKLLIYEVPTV